MHKHIISGLVAAMILGVALAAVAQQDADRAQRFRQRREAQMKAVETIQQHAAKLKADMEASAQAMRDRSQWQNMSEEERNQLRESFMKRREQQQKLLADIELQVNLLRGSRQLRTEHEEAIGKLQAIHDLAVQEKATRTAQRLQKMIAQRQTAYDQTLEKLGFQP